MTARVLFVLLAACGAREPAHTEAAASPTATASAWSEHHVSNPPSDRVGTMTVSGRLPPEIIEHVLKPILPRARACNPKATSTDDGDAKAVMRFVIGRQGEVASVKLDDSSNVPDSVAACVSAIFESLQFPAPEGGIVTVVYPLFFHTP